MYVSFIIPFHISPKNDNRNGKKKSTEQWKIVDTKNKSSEQWKFVDTKKKKKRAKLKISEKKKEKSKKMNRSIYTVSISDNKTKKKVGDSDSALAEKLIR